jgi:thiol-disulfide isomerase/thioredoxin
MITRREAILAAAVALVCGARPVVASEISSKFSWQAFEAAQNEGKPIVLEIYAAWCPVCRVQRPIIEDLVMSDRFKGIVYFEIDFDRQKDVLRKLNAQKQATLIVFKGKNEVGRSTGDTGRGSIERLMAKAL